MRKKSSSSVVVIDAEKHKLDYKTKRKKDNDIAYLKKKYQGRVDENGHIRVIPYFVFCIYFRTTCYFLCRLLRLGPRN